ncbi:erythromycin esterase family protein [Natrarchaeobaculum aegyptiacum]|uniref:Succinoglycan biosynthesis n=1 Tax=Natrarchaeobaculum aegyptiacum TaxID=745377 RepID=A0A2Z2HUD0_9EURY|nr:erythromycin esterase family protein [Natrarchaeobaculum aegyptiacum]ARS90849.1 hypothetical protein B1756_14700 [Natrarchaeobaculum aegyptiacum]
MQERFTRHLERYTTPIQETRPGASVDDLAPLGDRFDRKRIIGLGEATHGTKEFFQLKHRLIRFAVTELDFLLIGLESNFAETVAINEYVISGSGEPYTALAGLSYWPWKTEEMLALVEWVRMYNEGRPDSQKVQFYGFDMQSVRGSARRIETILKRVDADCRAELESEITTLTTTLDPTDSDNTFGWLTAATTVVTELRDRFRRREDAYRAQLTPREWQLATHHLRVIEQSLEFHESVSASNDADPNGVRDRCMAENVSRIMGLANEDRIILWAHNGHLKRGEFATSHRANAPKTMGHHLEQEYGDRYHPVGFEFGTGAFQAYPDPDTSQELSLRSFSVESVPDETVPAVLAGVDGSCWYLDITSAVGDQVVDDWIDTEQIMHNIGSVHLGEFDAYVPVTLAEAFDGLIYVTETHRAVPIDA